MKSLFDNLMLFIFIPLLGRAFDDAGTLRVRIGTDAVHQPAANLAWSRVLGTGGRQLELDGVTGACREAIAIADQRDTTLSG